VDIEVVVRTGSVHRAVGTGTAERTVADHMLSGMVVAAAGIVLVVAYSRVVLMLSVCRADCHNWRRSAHRERFSVHSWYRRHSLAQHSLLAGSVHSCYRKHCWLVLPPGRRDSGGLRVVQV
jgi:hypothetical protein